MDYIEFKKALRAVGEGKNASEIYKNLYSLKHSINKVLSEWDFYISFENPSYFEQGISEDAFLPRIVEVLESIKEPNQKIKTVILKALIKIGEVEKWDTFKPIMDLIKAELAELETRLKPKPGKVKTQKPIPDLPEIFKSKDYFELVVLKKTEDYWNFDRETGRYYWIDDKTLLAGLAYQLREKNRLNKDFDIYNAQFLSKVFCNFFNQKHDEKTFRTGRVADEHREPFKKWITDFTENSKF